MQRSRVKAEGNPQPRQARADIILMHGNTACLLQYTCRNSQLLAYKHLYCDNAAVILYYHI